MKKKTKSTSGSKTTIDTILKNIGVNDMSELNDMERETFNQYQKILSDQELTIDDVKRFVANQYQIAQKELIKWDNTKEKDCYMKAVVRNLGMLDVFLNSKDRAKDALTKQLSERFNITV